jgi:hypothetical protein
MAYFRGHMLLCADPECLSRGAHAVIDALQDELVFAGMIDEVQVLETSRIGHCFVTRSSPTLAPAALCTHATALWKLSVVSGARIIPSILKSASNAGFVCRCAISTQLWLSHEIDLNVIWQPLPGQGG